MTKISVLGSGEIGSHVALFCAIQKLGDVYILDRDSKKAFGHASDISQTLSGLIIDNEVNGGYEKSMIKDSDVVVVAVGQRRKAGMKRIDLLETNKGDVEDCANIIKKFSPDAKVIVVTNPVDEMTEIVRKITGISKRKIFAFGNALDTARFREAIHRQTKKPRSQIRCVVTGYHDENVSHYYDGDEEIDTDESRYMAINTIQQKGATVFAPSILTVELIKNIID